MNINMRGVFYVKGKTIRRFKRMYEDEKCY